MPTTKTRLRGPMSQRLRDARTTAGLSRRELADLTGLSLRTVNYYEDRAYARNRKLSFVKAWADATSRDLEELWGPLHQPISRTGWLSQIPGEGAFLVSTG